MELAITPSLRKLLTEVLDCPKAPEELRKLAQQHAQTDRVPWSTVKACNEALREHHTAAHAPLLHQACHGSHVVLTPPPARQRAPELVARLDKLQQQLDNKRYAEMVADITEKERAAEEMRNSILPTTRLQLTFGAHVLVTMFTFFAVAYYGSKWFFGYSELWAGLLGVVGLTTGLLVETLLLIIRSNRPVPLEDRMPHLFDAKAIKESFELVAKAKSEKKAGQRKAAPSSAPPADSKKKQ